MAHSFSSEVTWGSSSLRVQTPFRRAVTLAMDSVPGGIKGAGLIPSGLIALYDIPAFRLNEISEGGVLRTTHLLGSWKKHSHAYDDTLLASYLLLKKRADDKDPLHAVPHLKLISEQGDLTYLAVRNAVGILGLILQASHDHSNLILTTDQLLARYPSIATT